ncbi:MAG TPA: MFS transporter, partial [Actinotalea sp.]|nr:MFS transporter [Actinotalea sp.]
MSATARRLVRDRLTVALYSSFVMWGWFLYGFGPAVPLLADEQGISRAQAGLHGTALAVGTVLAGTVSAGLARRSGRRGALLVGLAITGLGISALMLGSTLVLTLGACLVAAVGGNLVLSAATPALVQHHGLAGPAAVTEANAIGATVGLLAPLAVGLTVALGWGWRPAVALVLLLGAGSAVLVARLGAEPALDRAAPATPA